MMNRVQSQLEAVGDAEFVKDVVEMVLDGLLADEELFADFFVAEALSDELDDFLFAVAEQGLFAARAGFGGLGEGFQDLGGHAVIEPDFAGVDAVNAFYEQIGGGLLENDAAGAEAHGADNVAIVFGGSEDDDAGRERVEIDFLEDGQAVFIGHAEVEQENIGLELGDKLDALGAVLSFTNDGDVFVSAEELAQAVAENGMVIREEDTNLWFCFGHVSRAESR
jgi:hypothetical protein